MSQSEIDALEALLRARPKALDTPRRRAAYDALGDRFPVASDVRIEAQTLGGVPCEASLTDAARGQDTLVYLHGGGYVYGSLKSHRHLASELGRAAGARAIAVDYRRAPEAPFPAALDDAVAVWRALLDQGLAPQQIALAGDSAGGGLAVALMVRLRELGLVQPAGAVLFSPWVDMLASGVSSRLSPMYWRAQKLMMPRCTTASRVALSVYEAPLASPVRADLRGLAPLAVFVGATETLLDDAIALARAAGMADVAVRLEIWPRMVHIWPNYFPMLAQGRQALAVAGAALREFLAPSS